ncbi:MAG: hypothetical protein ACKPFA_28995, partial [Dolichospermum sp.]
LSPLLPFIRGENNGVLFYGDYFVYEVVTVKENTVVLTPYKGEQWGERFGENYEYSFDSLYPYTGSL